MKFILTLETELKKSAPVSGGLDIDQKTQDAMFFDEKERIVAEMRRVRIEWVGADVMCLSGVEPTGVDRLGRETYRHQKWFLRSGNTQQKPSP